LGKEFSLVESRRLDALRGLAALAVVVVHQGQIFRQNPIEQALRFVTDLGKHGVAIFFILSGYLLARNLNSSAQTFDNYRKFMTRRFFRIYPAYLLTLIYLTLFTNVDGANFVSHLFLVQFINNRLFGGINYPFWSLGIEFWFYALIPLLVWYVNSKILNKLFLFAVFASLLWEALGSFCRTHFGFDARYDWSSRLFILTSITPLLLGVVLGKNSHVSSKVKLMINTLSIIAICDVCLSFTPAHEGLLNNIHKLSSFAFRGSFGFLVYGCLGAKLILLSWAPTKNWDRILERLFIKLGHISFSVYLWHVPVLNYCNHRFGYGLGSLALAIVSILIISNISYVIVERPFIQLGRKITSSRALKS